MRFRNLPAQRKTDPRATGFRREKRNEKICRVHDAWTGVAHENFDAFFEVTPPGRDGSLRFQRSFGTVVQNVDEQLLQLRGVRFDGDISARNNPNWNPRL